MSSFFDDIDEDHFLVRRHLQRCSLKDDGDSLARGQTRISDNSLLLQKPQLSSVAKKPIKFPPNFTKSEIAIHQEPSRAEEPRSPLDEAVSLCHRRETDETLEGSQSLRHEALDPTVVESPQETETVRDDSMSSPEVEMSKLSLPPAACEPQKIDDGDDELDSRQVSTPDSLEEELELKQIHETRKTQLVEGEFKMEARGSSSSGDADATAVAGKVQQTPKRMSKIISYDEALNIPQTDDDKQRMTSSARHKERPSNLSLLGHSPVRPTSARVRPRKSTLYEQADRTDSLLGSMQSLNSCPRTPRIQGSLNGSFAGSGEDGGKEDLLRRTQSFRSSRSTPGGSRRSTLGAELVNHVQENVKNLYTSFEYLSPKDQRVLAVMLAKREKEREEERIKEEIKLRWELEKMAKERSRQSLHQTLNESAILECGHKTSQECIAESCSFFKSMTLEERKMHENRAKLQQALDRKKKVEQRLEELKRKDEKYKMELLEKQQKELERATNVKRERNAQIKQKISKQNESAKQKLEQLKFKRPSEKELIDIEENMKATLSAAEMKAKRIKEEEALKISKKLQSKIERAHQAQRSIEEELRSWQEQALTYRQQQDKLAETLQATQLAQRRESLTRAREAKDKSQRENLKRILERDKEWRETVEATIQTKEEKIKHLSLEKQSLVQKSRAQAQLTRRLREELKLNQSLTDLDKLSRYVDLQRKILD